MPLHCHSFKPNLTRGRALSRLASTKLAFTPLLESWTPSRPSPARPLQPLLVTVLTENASPSPDSPQTPQPPSQLTFAPKSLLTTDHQTTQRAPTKPTPTPATPLPRTHSFRSLHPGHVGSLRKGDAAAPYQPCHPPQILT